MDKQKRIEKEWGEYFDEVKHMLDKEGWYNGGNDKIQKVFDKIEVTKMMYHQIPTNLLSEPVLIENDLEPIKIEQKKKVVHSIKK